MTHVWREAHFTFGMEFGKYRQNKPEKKKVSYISCAFDKRRVFEALEIIYND
jgi:hypothetical protein